MHAPALRTPQIAGFDLGVHGLAAGILNIDFHIKGC